MKVTSITLLLTAVGTATAFVPVSRVSQVSTTLNVASELDGMVGASAETGNKIFDPFGLNEFVPADWARATELANGRSAMLATVGWLWPAWYGTFASDDVTTLDPIKAIGEASPQWWAQFIILCGVVEAYKFKEAENGKSWTHGGTPVFDYMKGYPDDEAGRRNMELKELKNGRLAMLGFASFVSAHFIPGSVPLLPADFV